MKFVEKYMVGLKNEGIVWGYDLPYLLTGLLNQHPGAVIDKIKTGETDFARFHTVLWDREH